MQLQTIDSPPKKCNFKNKASTEWQMIRLAKQLFLWMMPKLFMKYCLYK